MPKLLARIIAALLVPCLIADSSFAWSGVLRPCALSSAFAFEALSGADIASAAPSLVGNQAAQRIRREAGSAEAGRIDRRMIIITGSLSGVGALTAWFARAKWYGLHSQPTSQSIPKLSQIPETHLWTIEEARLAAIKILDSAEFKAQVQEILDKRLLPEEVVGNENDLREAIKLARDLLDRGTVEELPSNQGAGMRVKWTNEEKSFGIEPAIMSDPEIATASLFHEILHLALKQREMEDKVSKITKSANAEFGTKFNAEAFKSNSKYQTETRDYVRIKAAMELLAWYGSLAWLDLDADHHGQKLTDYFYARLKPYADDAGVSVDAYVATMYHPRWIVGITARSLANVYVFSQIFRRGGIDRIFTETFIRQEVLPNPMFIWALQALSELPPQQGGLRRGQNYMDWVHDMLFPTSRKRGSLRHDEEDLRLGKIVDFVKEDQGQDLVEGTLTVLVLGGLGTLLNSVVPNLGVMLSSNLLAASALAFWMTIAVLLIVSDPRAFFNRHLAGALELAWEIADGGLPRPAFEMESWERASKSPSPMVNIFSSRKSDRRQRRTDQFQGPTSGGSSNIPTEQRQGNSVQRRKFLQWLGVGTAATVGGIGYRISQYLHKDKTAGPSTETTHESMTSEDRAVLEEITHQLREATDRYYAEMRRLAHFNQSFNQLKPIADIVGQAIIHIFTSHESDTQMPEIGEAMAKWRREGKLTHMDLLDMVMVLEHYFARHHQFLLLGPVMTDIDGYFIPGIYQVMLAERVTVPGGAWTHSPVPGNGVDGEEVAVGRESISFLSPLAAFSVRKAWGRARPLIVYRIPSLEEDVETLRQRTLRHPTRLSLTDAVTLIRAERYEELTDHIISDLVHADFNELPTESVEAFRALVLPALRTVTGLHEWGHLAEPEGANSHTSDEAMRKATDHEVLAYWQELGYSGFPHLSIQSLFGAASMLPGQTIQARSHNPHFVAAGEYFNLLVDIIHSDRQTFSMVSVNVPPDLANDPQKAMFFYLAQLASIPRDIWIASGKHPIARGPMGLNMKPPATRTSSDITGIVTGGLGTPLTRLYNWLRGIGTPEGIVQTVAAPIFQIAYYKSIFFGLPITFGLLFRDTTWTLDHLLLMLLVGSVVNSAIYATTEHPYVYVGNTPYSPGLIGRLWLFVRDMSENLILSFGLILAGFAYVNATDPTSLGYAARFAPPALEPFLYAGLGIGALADVLLHAVLNLVARLGASRGLRWISGTVTGRSDEEKPGQSLRVEHEHNLKAAA